MKKVQKYKLYNDTVTLSFDEDSHIYSVDGEQVFGVTNIIKVLDKPALVAWASNMTIDFYKGALKAGQIYSEVDLQNIHGNARGCYRRISDTGKFIGSIVHEWIENFINAGLSGGTLPERPVDQNINLALDAFLAWTKNTHLKFLLSEQKIYSKRNKFAGTLDAEAKTEKGLCIVDFKTSSGIYSEFWDQVSAYLFARAEETNQDYAGAFIVRIDKITGDLDVQFKSTSELSENYNEVFLSCLKIYKYQQNIKNKKK